MEGRSEDAISTFRASPAASELAFDVTRRTSPGKVETTALYGPREHGMFFRIVSLPPTAILGNVIATADRSGPSCGIDGVTDRSRVVRSRRLDRRRAGRVSRWKSCMGWP